MAERYIKPALSFEAQVEQLARRGMLFNDPAAAARTLAHVSYYRLSAYWHPFKRPDDSFEAGTRFETAVSLYEFDRHLRLQLLDAIERAEVGLRTALTYRLGHDFGAFAHCDRRHFRREFKFHRWLHQACQTAEQSNEVFVQHFKRKYEEFPELPLWMVTEILPFGALSRLYEAMLPEQQRPIAREYGVHHEVLRSWLRSLSYVRNLCAHHSRVWNRELAVSPDVPRHLPDWQPPTTPTNKRVFAVLLILRQVLKSHADGRHWQARVSELIRSQALPPVSRAAMGLPEHWLDHPLWNVA
jgi:abortive infection bacteriophage resistance protein